MPVVFPLALLLAVLLPACITEDIRLAPPANTPPVIFTETDVSPLHRLIELAPATAGGSDFPERRLEVVVRDPDIDQDLQWLLFIDERDTPGPPDDADSLPADGLSHTRDLTITLPLGTLMVPGCHRVELFVSAGFDCFPMCSPEPVEQGDLGSATWWVITRTDPGDSSPVDVNRCTAL